MRILVPLTGTVIEYKTQSGDPDDPIRLINIKLGNVSWRLKNLDLDNDLAEIEVSPAETVGEETINAEGKIVYKERNTTKGEKDILLAHVRSLIEGKSKDELYALSKSPRLKKPPREDE